MKFYTPEPSSSGCRTPLYEISPLEAMGAPDMITEMDPGDEDDGADVERRWLATRMCSEWRYRAGVRCFFPAMRCLSMPDHDPGDEQPRMVRNSSVAL